MNRRSRDEAFSINAVLQDEFFQRPAANVARDLLGKSLVRKQGTSFNSSVVVETEAYEGGHTIWPPIRREAVHHAPR